MHMCTSTPNQTNKRDQLLKKNSTREENESLHLNLGGRLTCMDELVSRPDKRVHSSSLGNTNYPMDQVNNCKDDLSNVKDYHHHHKVCELHSKATKALVTNQMQRFYQYNINSLPLLVDLAAKLHNLGSLGRKISEQTFSDQFNGRASQSTMNLLAILSATLSVLSQRSSPSSDSGKTKLNSHDQASSSVLQKRPQEFPLKIFSSDSSNPTEERSPSSSPPVMQTLFPIQTMAEMVNRIHGYNRPFDLFRGSNKGADVGSLQSVPYHAGYTSSGSDHSPSSLSSDAQDRTGRIMFKLLDKDPSHFPETLRSQIFNWLSNSPSEMESYIRPCVILSVYASMPCSMGTSKWMSDTLFLEENLLQHISSFVQSSDIDFWRNGRFLAKWSSQELISVSPLGGQETSLILKGRSFSNLAVKGSTYHGTEYEEINLNGFKIHDASPGVENGLKGNSFPLIIADASICKDLRVLVTVFDEEEKVSNIIAEGQNHDDGRPSNSSALIKTLLDILVERNFDGNELSRESVEMLSEIQLLHRAVMRKCRKMVDLLVNYSLIALSRWNSLLDANGQSPYAYAVMTNNQSYNKLVARKLADKRNGQLSLTIRNETSLASCSR
ncbi:hypothetical protein UlMin_028354 [Ulmus minor]